MAVEKRKYSNRTTYRAYWRNPWTGKIEKGLSRETLKEARKDDAEIKIKLEYEPEYFLPDGVQPSENGPTLYHLSQIYLARTDLAQSTRKCDFYHFKSIAPALGSIPAKGITREDLKDFEAKQRESGVKQGTVQRRISIIRAILNWAVDSGLIDDNPVQGYRCKRGETLKIPPPSPAEIKAMLAAAPPHLKRVILLGYYLGVRVGQSELLSLQWADYDHERKRIRVWSAKKNKDRPWRDVDISPIFQPVIEAWFAQDSAAGLTHLVTFEGEPIQSIKRTWKTMMKNLADPKQDGGPKITRRIRPYDLRHAFATEAIAAGADIKAVSDLMGHSSTAMIHRHYQHVVDEQKKKVVQSIPDVLDGVQVGVQTGGTKQVLSGCFSYPDKYYFNKSI